MFDIDMAMEKDSAARDEGVLSLSCSEVELKGGTELITKGPLVILSETSVGNGAAAAAIY